MNTRIAFSLLPLLASGALFSGGCKEDPPPPPPPGAGAAASVETPEKQGKAAEVTTQVPAYTDATTKRFRTELCFYGAYGLKLARDTYLASLKGGEPAPGKLPSFALPDPEVAPAASTDSKVAAGSSTSKRAAKTAAAGAAATTTPVAKTAAGAATATAVAKTAPAAVTAASNAKTAAEAATATAAPSAKAAHTGEPAVVAESARNDVGLLGQRLPFTRFLSSCNLAGKTDAGATSAPEDVAIDKALAEFEPYASTLNRQLMSAQRYYASKQHDADKFERGKTMHEGLVKSFGELDKNLEAFRATFEAWQAGWGKAAEKLDKAGDLSTDSLINARKTTSLLLADAVDAEAVGRALDALVASRDALDAAGKEDPKAAHPRGVGPRFTKVIEVHREAVRAIKGKKVPMASLYAVTAEMALLVEAHHRATGQVLRASGQTKAGGPMRMLTPRIDAVRGRAEMRARPETTPKAGAE
ncbi:MAG: DUF3829 domain-containing protein [Myxococcales bacterium]|nr:DUF3829 domain-containing protein [Myxococcales bacterium]